MPRTSLTMNSEIVKAGAGAGKTTALTERVMQMAQEYRAKHARWPRMVVTTFTRKATQELRERLMTKAINSGDLAFLEYVCAKSQLSISTIHGVCHQFLKKYGHLLGYDAQ